MVDDDIATLLADFTPPLQEVALGVLAAVRPIAGLTPKVQFGWRSVNFRHVRAGFICGVFPFTDHVDLIFENGRLLDSPLLVDNGKVKRVRWIPFRPGDPIPGDEIAILLAEAIALRG